MKKYIVCLVALALLLAMLSPYSALGEATEPAAPPEATAPVVTINLTGLVVAILVAFFELMLMWLMKAVVPPLRSWLDSHTTKNQQAVVWNIVRRLVEAAEQTITGLHKGESKLAYVKSMLKRHGIEVDDYVIEAAVKEMNDRLLTAIEDELDIEFPPDDVPDEDKPGENQVEDAEGD